MAPVFVQQMAGSTLRGAVHAAVLAGANCPPNVLQIEIKLA